MNIAYVCADRGVPVFGHKGCSIHVQEVLRALRRQGHQVTLFAARLGGDPPSDLADIAIHRLPKVPKHDPALREQRERAANLDLRFALEQAGGFDLVYERYSLWSFTAMEYARDRAIPGILEVNAPLIEEQARYRQLIHPAEAQRVAQRVFGAASLLVAVSQGIADYLATFPQTQGRVQVIANGVNPSRFDRSLGQTRPLNFPVPGLTTPSPSNSPLPILGEGLGERAEGSGLVGGAHPTGERAEGSGLVGGAHPTGEGAEGYTNRLPFTIGFVGTMKTWHGLPTLMEAFAQLHGHCPQTRLLMVGDGPARGECQTWLEQRGLGDAVVWTGAVAPDHIPHWLGQMDVAVAPYPQLEDFYFSPLKVYEYMAAGLPVVASDIGQLRQVIRPGHNGILCPPGDALALTQALRSLATQPQLRQTLGQQARQTILNGYTWNQVVSRMLRLATQPAPKTLQGVG